MPEPRTVETKRRAGFPSPEKPVRRASCIRPGLGPREGQSELAATCSATRFWLEPALPGNPVCPDTGTRWLRRVRPSQIGSDHLRRVEASAPSRPPQRVVIGLARGPSRL
jgi:hypothetical protein